jgi:tetratricopeptide (TPR) repeat protein
MPSYRTILVVVTILSLTITSLGQVRNSLVLTIGLMNIFMWMYPIFAKWKKKRDAIADESARQLRVGNYPEAEKLLIRALGQADEQRRPRVWRVRMLRRLAEARRKQGKFAQAEETVTSAIEMVSDQKVEELDEYGFCLEELAAIHQAAGNYPLAQTVLQELLSIEEHRAKPNLEWQAKRSQLLALAFHSANDYRGASPHFARALELHEQAFGPEHAETGRMLTELGAAQQREGKHAEAFRNLERALAIQEKTLGCDSPAVAQSLYHLALACEKSGNLEQAADLYERMLTLRERQVGGSEAEVARAYHHLASVSMSLGRLARAGEAAQSAILILERNPVMELATALETLAAISESAGLTSEAATARDRAREVRKVAGSTRPATA